MTAAIAMHPGVVAHHGPVLLVRSGPEVHGFVVDSWCKSYEPVALSMLGLPKPDGIPGGLRRLICSGLYQRVKATLGRAEVLAAVAEEAPTVVLGYVVYEPCPTGPRVHYVYVGSTVRRRGLAAALLDAAGASKGGTHTHHTPAGAALLRRFGLTYSPQEM